MAASRLKNKSNKTTSSRHSKRVTKTGKMKNVQIKKIEEKSKPVKNKRVTKTEKSKNVKIRKGEEKSKQVNHKKSKMEKNKKSKQIASVKKLMPTSTIIAKSAQTGKREVINIKVPSATDTSKKTKAKKQKIDHTNIKSAKKGSLTHLQTNKSLKQYPLRSKDKRNKKQPEYVFSKIKRGTAEQKTKKKIIVQSKGILEAQSSSAILTTSSSNISTHKPRKILKAKRRLFPNSSSTLLQHSVDHYKGNPSCPIPICTPLVTSSNTTGIGSLPQPNISNLGSSPFMPLHNPFGTLSSSTAPPFGFNSRTNFSPLSNIQTWLPHNPFHVSATIKNPKKSLKPSSVKNNPLSSFPLMPGNANSLQVPLRRGRSNSKITTAHMTAGTFVGTTAITGNPMSLLNTTNIPRTNLSTFQQPMATGSDMSTPTGAGSGIPLAITQNISPFTQTKASTSGFNYHNFNPLSNWPQHPGLGMPSKLPSNALNQSLFSQSNASNSGFTTPIGIPLRRGRSQSKLEPTAKTNTMISNLNSLMSNNPQTMSQFGPMMSNQTTIISTSESNQKVLPDPLTMGFVNTNNTPNKPLNHVTSHPASSMVNIPRFPFNTSHTSSIASQNLFNPPNNIFPKPQSIGPPIQMQQNMTQPFQGLFGSNTNAVTMAPSTCSTTATSSNTYQNPTLPKIITPNMAHHGTYKTKLSDESQQKFRDLRVKYGGFLQMNKQTLTTDELMNTFTAKELKEVLKLNDRSSTGNKEQLAEEVCECIKKGCPPRCPKCGGGRLRVNHKNVGGYPYDELYCPGYMDDDVKEDCDFKTDIGVLVIRIPFKYL